MKNQWLNCFLNVVLAIIFSSLTACFDNANNDVSNQKKRSQSTIESQTLAPSNPEWESHIAANPPQYVSATKPFTLTFSHSVSGENPLNKYVSGLMSIEPEVAHKVIFKSQSSIQIEFQEPLQRSTPYTIKIFSQKLEGVNSNLPPYQFTIEAFRQDFDLKISGLNIGSDNSHTITGRLTLNDQLSSDPKSNLAKISSFLSASQSGTSKPVSWLEKTDTQYDFTVKGIVQADSASRVLLSWKGKAIGVSGKKGEQVVAIPARDNFAVVSAIAHQEDDQYIQVHFSQPLLSRQNLKGLIKVAGQLPKSVRIDGNKLMIYPRQLLTGKVELTIDAGIKSAIRTNTKKTYQHELTFLAQKPGIRFTGNQYLVPKKGKMIATIEAVNVDSLRIKGYKMPIKNLGQFLQRNQLQEAYPDTYTSTPAFSKTYYLPEIPRDRWQKFDIDLGSVLSDMGNDLLGLEIEIDQSHSILDCGTTRPTHKDQLDKAEWPTDTNAEAPGWVDSYYHSRGYGAWRDRDNPCKKRYFESTYHNDVHGFRYFMPASMALIAKMGTDHLLHLVATDIATAKPKSNVTLKAYNYQHQPVGEAVTDSQGMATIKPVAAPFYVLAESDGDISFIRLARNNALSSNVFDVGGTKSNTGIKGYFYGERGVWRPGDDIYLTFITLDKSGRFPQGYPLTLDFFDPQGNKHLSQTQANPLNGFYTYKLSTPEKALTGNWRVVIRYGQQYFDKVIPVETVVPNRLKVELEFPDSPLGLEHKGMSIGLYSQWLSGLMAQGLKADVKMLASQSQTKIAGFDQYVFDDPAREVNRASEMVFEGNLDENGQAEFTFDPNFERAPGQLNLYFTTRVFEKSGRFSIQYLQKTYFPYTNWVGLNIPKGNGWNGAIARDEVHTINLLSVNSQGDRQSNKALELSVYQLGWRWWWDYSNDNIGAYLNSEHSTQIDTAVLDTNQDGVVQWQLDGKKYDWGRYFIRVCRKDSGHCAGQVVYLGWSDNNTKNPSGETQLMLSTDKKSYSVGETAYLRLPQAPKDASHRILLSLETGSKVLSQQWIDDEIKNGQIEIPVTAEMAPNVYANVTLIQAHENKGNDAPVRLYGIAPIQVTNPNTHLTPVIEAPDSVRPEGEIRVKISEKNDQAMTYTLAVVDEGLLGITNFKTPNPHQAFYRREALGVLTWDLFDLLSQARSGQFNSLLTLGGGDSGDDEDINNRKRRFPPVVRFMGPFELKANAEQEHSIDLPQYMGAVRVMVVAARNTDVRANASKDHSAAFGRVAKTVKVTQPLTLLATMPRVLGPNESFTLPVSVFVTDDNIKKVNISVQANDLFDVESPSKQVDFETMGEQITAIDLSTKSVVGKGFLTVKATTELANGKTETALQSVYIDIRSPNEPTTRAEKVLVMAGQSKTLSMNPVGILNTNKAYLQISRMPELNLSEQLDYLISYPHGCLEQTTSKLFAQLYLGSLISLSTDQKTKISEHIRAGIKKLRTFQRSDGFFNYWPNGNYYNRWANSYAGHFLLEAKRKGYVVSDDMLSNWLSAQKGLVATRKGHVSSYAYALYTLALSGKPDFTAMNQLKAYLQDDNNNIDSNVERVARWLLSASYAKAGIVDAAQELMQGQNKALDYDTPGYTYGSRMRDSAILMLAQTQLNQDNAAWDSAELIAKQFNQDKWQSTQSRGWALMALAGYFQEAASSNTKKQGDELSYRVNKGMWHNVSLYSPVFQQALNNADKPLQIEIKNASQTRYFATLSSTGVPANNQEQPINSHVEMDVTFVDKSGNPIDVSKLAQGTDFIARVSITALDEDSQLDNLALVMTVPSGWQINNSRMEGKALADGLEYQDIQDDRVLSYFSLGRYYDYHRYSKRSIELEFAFNASFKGKFYLPGWQVSAMYDDDIKSKTRGQWVEVVNKATLNNEAVAGSVESAEME